MTSLIRRLWYRMTQTRHDADLAEEIETHRQLRQAQLERDGPLPRRRGAGEPARPRQPDARPGGRPGGMDLRVDRTRLAGPRRWPCAGCATARRSRWSRSARSRSASAPTRRCSRSSTACCCASCRYASRPASSSSTRARTRIRSGRPSRRRRRRCSRAPSPTATSNWISRLSGQRQPVDAAYASGGLFDVLGVTAIRGRLLQPSDDRPDANALRGGDQPPLLAAALRGRRQRDRRHAHARSPALHHRRRDAAGLLGAGRRAPRRRHDPLRRRTRPARRRQRPRRALDVVARDHGPPEARREPRAGQRRARDAAAGDPDGGDPGGRGELPRGSADARVGGDRAVAAAQPIRNAAAGDAGDGGRRAADRLRQPRQPDARAGAGAPARVERPAGPGRLAMARHAPARGGNGGHRRGGRGPRRALRQMEQRPAGPAAGDVARVGVPRSVARLARPRLHRRTRRRHRRDRGDRPGALGDRRGPRRCDEGVVPDRHRRPPPQRPRRPGRGADCAVARPRRRRRPVPAHVRSAQRDAARLRGRRPHGRQRQPACVGLRTGGAPRPARAPRRGDGSGSGRPRCRSVRHRADHGLGLERPGRRRPTARRPRPGGPTSTRSRRGGSRPWASGGAAGATSIGAIASARRTSRS